MLVLTRKVGESLLIGGRVRVKLVSVDGFQVRLGVQAPADVQVLREELASGPVKIDVAHRKRKR